ncbi:type I secretion C-terminal target domain-containing protein [Idiomarina piscisalsi]|uniref:type I secretion C-terminal target domain-containing protein n=1 Tax=Idiomarina piscisalsi TaxID=1096243 RepID=UPI0018E5874C|nr:type I secretion C-terminal target domain-containing protein [Idiomarina piscisalsi]
MTRSDNTDEQGADTDIVVFSGQVNGNEKTLVIDSEGISKRASYFTNDKTGGTVGVHELEVSGVAEPGSEVELLDTSGQVVGRVTVDGSGQWQTLLSADTLNQGELTAKATDTQGNITTDTTQYHVGTKGNDSLMGDTTGDVFYGGAGSDEFIGGGNNDTFIWKGDDEGTVNIPEVDTIQDFALGNFTTDDEADRLDLSELLQGESVSSIDSYLHAEDDGNGNTVLYINSEGDLNGSDNANQLVTLQDVQMAEGQSSSDFIQQMLNDGQLLIDSGSSASTHGGNEGAYIGLNQVDKTIDS